ncbi:MAG TPA: UDP-glucose 4-epimerase GalE [Candidatus Deferrimicrobiaceae bacterium]|nr:UDP-glucose 4-epimerase GalE [Candidatus Deferrimicrobiaceae bacterium]
MRILVTGGAGYVGSVSVEALVAGGHAVVVLDDLSTGHESADLAGARLVRGSYGDVTMVGRLLAEERIDAVLHCGARSLVGESILDPALYYRENVGGGIALLEAMREAGVRRLVISSTAAVYGEPDATPIPEDAPLRPINPYGETKRVLETAAGWYAAAYGLRVVSLRYFNVAGASDHNGEAHEPETHLIPNALAAADGGQALTVFGDDYATPDGTPIRDYVHVLDLAEAHRAALEATDPADPRTERPLACNVGSGGGYSVNEIIEAAEQVVGRPVPRTVGPRRQGDPPVLVAAIDRAREVLGWRPVRSSLEVMIGSAWASRQARDDTAR